MLKIYNNMILFGFRRASSCRNIMKQIYRTLTYIQGQTPEPFVREYFYFVDHQGMLFLDDSKMKNFTSCFKDKKFLEFFFKQLRLNNTRKYESEFPYYSPCGRERNYVRCDDLPIVFTHIFEATNDENRLVDYLSYAHTGNLLKVEFKPSEICMLPESGRVYHPGPEKTGGVGLIKSSLAIQLSKKFVYKDPENTEDAPLYFLWKGKKYTLKNNVLEKLKIIKKKTM